MSAGVRLARKVKRRLQPIQLGDASPLVLAYHRVVPDSTAAMAASMHSVSLDRLDRHLGRVAKQRRFVSLPELLDELDRGTNGRKLAAVTFDDGHPSVATMALPVLQAHGVRAALALCSSLMGGGTFWRDRIVQIEQLDMVDRLADHAPDVFDREGIRRLGLYRWTKTASLAPSDQVVESLELFVETMGLAAPESEWTLDAKALAGLGANFDVINHTDRHFVLASVSSDQQRREVIHGAEGLANAGLIVQPILAAPFGGDADTNRETLAVLADLGYRAMLSNTTGSPRPARCDRGVRVIQRYMPLESAIWKC